MRTKRVATYAALLMAFISAPAGAQTPPDVNGWEGCPQDPTKCPPYITPAHMRAHQAQVAGQLAAMNAEREALREAVIKGTGAVNNATVAVKDNTAALRARTPSTDSTGPSWTGWHGAVLLTGGGVFLNDGPEAYLLTVEGLLRHIWRSGLGGEGGLSVGVWQTEDATPALFGLNAALVAASENWGGFLGGHIFGLQSFEEGGTLLLGTADAGVEFRSDGVILRAGPSLTVASSGPDGDPGEPNEAARLAGLWWRFGAGGYF